MKQVMAWTALSYLFICSDGLGGEVARYSYGPNSPIARATEVPEGYQLIFHSGVASRPLKSDSGDEAARWGDTETQTLSALMALENSIENLGLSLADVVKLTVYLVADQATGRMDFEGYMKGYTRFFGTEKQPNLPARATVQVAGLHSPGMLVEIEAILVRKQHQVDRGPRH